MNRQQRRAVQAQPSADALHQRGIDAYLTGQRQVAITYVSQAIRADGRNPLYHFNLARLYEEQGESVPAIAHYQQAIALHPGYTEALNNLGAVLRAAGRLEEAVTCFRRAVLSQPGFAFAQLNLGTALTATGQVNEAIAHLHNATRLAPLYAEAHAALGAAYVQAEQYATAVAAFTSALALKPGWPEALNNLGVAMAGQEDWPAAMAAYRQAIAAKPDFADAYYNLGKALKAQQLLPAAVTAYRAALAHNPAHAQAENNLGIALDELGQEEAAMECFRRAIALAPQFADAHFNLGTSLLARGDFAEGWVEFEHRFASTQMQAHLRRFTQPLWRGQAGPGILLLHAEQGFGDTLQFCRYAPLAAARGWTVILEVQAPLTGLLRSLPGVSLVIPQGRPVPAHDAQAPLLSLPGIFGTEAETIPAAIPYLQAPPWTGEKLPAQRRVGLCWAGNPRAFSRVLAQVDARRSIAPAAFAPLFTVPDVTFVSLQKEGPEMPYKLVNLMHQAQDFADTAALISNLDLVISVDTAVAHLAGALGKPVWLLNRFGPCWRWLQNRTDSPWYPTMLIFNQTAIGAWDSVINDVREALAGL